MAKLKNNEFRASQAILILRIIILFDIIMVAFDIAELNLVLRMMEGLPVGSHAERHNEIRQLLMSLFYTIVSFCSGLAFLGWFHRAYSNLNRFGPEKTRLRPYWTVWSFVLPGVNLYLPYVLAKETLVKYRSAIIRTGGSPKSGNPNLLLISWWTFWLLSILSSILYLLLLKLPLTRDHRLTLSLLSIFSDLIDIPAALLAIRLINLIRATENELLRLSELTNA